MKRKKPMEPENVKSSSISASAILPLMKSSGNIVYRFGYESILQNLV
jgi:hypothetical protein